MTKKVTMGLQEKDVERVDIIQKRLHSRSKAAAVSTAISIADIVTDVTSGGGSIIIENKDGTRERLVIAGLDHGR